MIRFLTLVLLLWSLETKAQSTPPTARWNLKVFHDGTTYLLGPDNTLIRAAIVQIIEDRIHVVDRRIQTTILFRLAEEYHGYTGVELPFETLALGTFTIDDATLQDGMIQILQKSLYPIYNAFFIPSTCSNQKNIR